LLLPSRSFFAFLSYAWKKAKRHMGFESARSPMPEKSKATYRIPEPEVTYAGKNRKATYRIGKPEVTYTFPKVGDRDCDTEKTAHTWWFTRCALFKKT
jgi:hypothetical protein